MMLHQRKPFQLIIARRFNSEQMGLPFKDTSYSLLLARPRLVEDFRHLDVASKRWLQTPSRISLPAKTPVAEALPALNDLEEFRPAFHTVRHHTGPGRFHTNFFSGSAFLHRAVLSHGQRLCQLRGYGIIAAIRNLELVVEYLAHVIQFIGAIDKVIVVAPRVTEPLHGFLIGVGKSPMIA